MPNYIMDHVELEDLMTFLLAQKGQSEAESEIEYKQAVQQWDAGKKLPWEKGITPTEEHDPALCDDGICHAGRAACHRLEGFESDMGYAVEKRKDASFDSSYEEPRGLKSCSPKKFMVQQIVKAIEANAQEIDKRIVTASVQTAFSKKSRNVHPRASKPYYSNFRFASRAKDAAFQKRLLKAAATADQKRRLERTYAMAGKSPHRILMMYVQEYGLGTPHRPAAQLVGRIP